MKAWIPLVLLMAGFAAQGHAADACTYPKTPDAPPDGNTATKDQMVAAAQEFKRYNADMTAYQDCMKAQMDNVAPKDQSKLSADQKKKAADHYNLLAQKSNAALEEQQAVIGKFNEQIRAFKAKNP